MPIHLDLDASARRILEHLASHCPTNRLGLTAAVRPLSSGEPIKRILDAMIEAGLVVAGAGGVYKRQRQAVDVLSVDRTREARGENRGSSIPGDCARVAPHPQ